MAYYRCGPTAIGSRTSWGPVSSPSVETKTFDRPLSGNFDRIFNAFERTNAFEYVKTFESKEGVKDERIVGHGDIVVNRKMSSSFERADCALAAQTPISEDEEFYREKILYSQARQLFPLQEDLADWINKTIGISYLNGENFLDVLDNGAELCQLAGAIQERARDAVRQGLIVGPVPQIRGRCWQRAARRSFFSRDNTENFITFCRDLGVHENLLFESDDLVLHNQPRQVILCLLEVARLATKFGVEPPGLVQLEKEIAMEERDSGLDSMSGPWQFRDNSPPTHMPIVEPPPTSPDQNESHISVPDNTDAESTKSEDTVTSTDSDVPLKPTNELDKRVQLVTRLMERGCSCGAGAGGRCSRLLKVKKVGEGRYNIAGRNVFIRLLKGRHMMVRVGGGWDTLEHFLSRHEPCQVRLVTQGRRAALTLTSEPASQPAPRDQAASPGGSERSTNTSLRDQSVSPVTTKRESLSPSNSKASLRDNSVSPISTKRETPSPSGSKTSLRGQSVSPTAPSSKASRDQSVSSLTSERGSKTSLRDFSVSPIGDTSRKTSPQTSGKTSTAIGGKISTANGKTAVNGKISAVNGKISPATGKISPSRSNKTSTPKPKNRASLTLPLRAESVEPAPARLRKQSAPSFSTPTTPGRSVRTPPVEYRKSLTSASLVNTPKKSRSMSLALHKDDRKFCGTDRLNSSKARSVSAASTPTDPPARKIRSQSLASTPVHEPKKLSNGYAKKTRSMSLATPVDFKPINKTSSVTISGALTQAAIEETIRMSLAATIADEHSSKKPFLHIKAKYRSPPPREVPPR